MIISAIAAMSKNRVIGKDGDLPWHLPADLKYFKRKTLDHHIIMGRVNFETIGNPLPKRTNIILTRNPYYAVSNAFVVHSLEEALSLAYENGEEEAFVIGGEEIYRLSLPYLDRIYLTEIDLVTDGDTFFPELSNDEWIVTAEEPHKKDENNPYDFVFRVLRRKSADERRTSPIPLEDKTL